MHGSLNTALPKFVRNPHSLLPLNPRTRRFEIPLAVLDAQAASRPTLRDRLLGDLGAWGFEGHGPKRKPDDEARHSYGDSQFWKAAGSSRRRRRSGGRSSSSAIAPKPQSPEARRRIPACFAILGGPLRREGLQRPLRSLEV